MRDSDGIYDPSLGVKENESDPRMLVVYIAAALVGLVLLVVGALVIWGGPEPVEAPECSVLDAALLSPNDTRYVVLAAETLSDNGVLDDVDLSSAQIGFFWVYNAETQELEYWVVVNGEFWGLEILCFQDIGNDVLPLFGEVKREAPR